jgi:hypothetical protein
MAESQTLEVQCKYCKKKFTIIITDEDRCVGGKSLKCESCNIILWFEINSEIADLGLTLTFPVILIENPP